MEIRDLRIGNYVEYNGMSTVVTELLSPAPRQPERFNNVPVVGLLCDGLITCPLSEVSPILVRSELLINLGFENEFDELNGSLYDIYYLPGNLISKYIIEYSLKDKCWYFTDDCEINIQVKYLHQIQNLYYMLVGAELNIIL